MKLAYLREIFFKISNLISPYLSFILVILFIIPWVNGKIAIHDSNEVLNLIEVFVLSSATLSLLTFTYIAAMTDLNVSVKKSMIKVGELFLWLQFSLLWV